MCLCVCVCLYLYIYRYTFFFYIPIYVCIYVYIYIYINIYVCVRARVCVCVCVCLCVCMCVCVQARVNPLVNPRLGSDHLVITLQIPTLPRTLLIGLWAVDATHIFPIYRRLISSTTHHSWPFRSVLKSPVFQLARRWFDSLCSDTFPSVGLDIG